MRLESVNKIIKKLTMGGFIMVEQINGTNKEGVNKGSDESAVVKLSKRELTILNYLIKTAKREKTSRLTLSLSMISHRLGCTKPNIYAGLQGLRVKGVVELQASDKGYIIDLSRVLESGILLKDIDKSIKKTKTPYQKIPVVSVGSDASMPVSPNPISANASISSEHTLQTEQHVFQPVKSAELVEMVNNLKGCAERIKDEEVLSFIKNFDFSSGYDKIYEKALELKRLLKGGKK
jgi:hypothetical protein